jgi:hypothetical protein
MDFDLRLKALTRLAESTSGAAVETLRGEFEQISSLLKSSSDYQDLQHGLQFCPEKLQRSC